MGILGALFSGVSGLDVFGDENIADGYLIEVAGLIARRECDFFAISFSHRNHAGFMVDSFDDCRDHAGLAGRK